MVLGWLNLQLLFSLVLSSMLSHMNFLHCMFGLVQLIGIVGMFEQTMKEDNEKSLDAKSVCVRNS